LPAHFRGQETIDDTDESPSGYQIKGDWSFIHKLFSQVAVTAACRETGPSADRDGFMGNGPSCLNQVGAIPPFVLNFINLFARRLNQNRGATLGLKNSFPLLLRFTER